MDFKFGKINRRYVQKKAIAWFDGLSPRERGLTVGAAVLLLFLGLSSPFSALSDYVDQTRRRADMREQELEEFIEHAKKYSMLAKKLEGLKASFKKSQLSFEQVTNEIDQIVRKSVGNNDYSLKKTRPPESLDQEFETQEFSLEINSLSLQQLVDVLRELEQRSDVLFVGKVDVLPGRDKDTLRTTISIASISKKKA
ncbi:MAG: type II secretion system protein M [Deltaproteobacteria bacterium]|nr:type II secretion system protein M [Deltaproteobacteria bacterium]